MKFRITPGAILFLAVLLWRHTVILPATLLAAALHEIGHILAAKCLHIPLRLFEWDIGGAKLYVKGFVPSYGAEWLLAAAGPAMSLLVALPTLPFHTPFATIFRAVTLSLACFNLLPIEGFDGGRMLGAVVGYFGGSRLAAQVGAVGSYVCLFFLFILSACLLLRYGQDLTLAVLCATLFAKLFLSAEKGCRTPAPQPESLTAYPPCDK